MKTRTSTLSHIHPKADDWFATGERITYDYHEKEIVDKLKHGFNANTSVRLWHRLVNENHAETGSEWTTMMPGFPDGSFGWAATEEYLSMSDQVARLYVEYVGMGDSDKPEGYAYSVIERADMIEALWRHYEIRNTILVTFDFSSIVALELLSRQISKTESGEKPYTTIIGFLSINGGLFADSHSHPILTTPLLKTSFGRIGARLAQNSTFAFNMMMKDLWSKEYGITKDELAENHNAIGRRGGAVFMSNAAGFVDEHKANAERWDLKRVFDATYPDVKYIVAGSEKDQFEHKQVKKARRELQAFGLEIEMFPGGHMTTTEYPDLIAATIAKLKSIL